MGERGKPAEINWCVSWHFKYLKSFFLIFHFNWFVLKIFVRSYMCVYIYIYCIHICVCLWVVLSVFFTSEGNQRLLRMHHVVLWAEGRWSTHMLNSACHQHGYSRASQQGIISSLGKVLNKSNIQGFGTLSAEWTEKAEGGEEPLDGPLHREQ